MAHVCRLHWQCGKVPFSKLSIWQQNCWFTIKIVKRLIVIAHFAASLILLLHYILTIFYHWLLSEILPRYCTVLVVYIFFLLLIYVEKHKDTLDNYAFIISFLNWKQFLDNRSLKHPPTVIIFNLILKQCRLLREDWKILHFELFKTILRFQEIWERLQQRYMLILSNVFIAYPSIILYMDQILILTK